MKPAQDGGRGGLTGRYNFAPCSALLTNRQHAMVEVMGIQRHVRLGGIELRFADGDTELVPWRDTYFHNDAVHVGHDAKNRHGRAARLQCALARMPRQLAERLATRQLLHDLSDAGQPLEFVLAPHRGERWIMTAFAPALLLLITFPCIPKLPAIGLTISHLETNALAAVIGVLATVALVAVSCSVWAWCFYSRLIRATPALLRADKSGVKLAMKDEAHRCYTWNEFLAASVRASRKPWWDRRLAALNLLVDQRQAVRRALRALWPGFAAYEAWRVRHRGRQGLRLCALGLVAVGAAAAALRAGFGGSADLPHPLPWLVAGFAGYAALLVRGHFDQGPSSPVESSEVKTSAE